MIRIVSFDFWFTLVWEDLEGLKYYQDRRIEVLYNALRNYTDVSLDEVRVFYKSTGGIRMLVSNKELIKFIFRMAGLTPTDDILDDIVKEYEEVVDNWKPHVNEEAYGVLEGLKKLGYKIAIISNTSFSERSLWFIIRNVGFDKYIDGVIASSEVGYIKPMREIFRELFNKFNVNFKPLPFAAQRIDNGRLPYLKIVLRLIFRALTIKFHK